MYFNFVEDKDCESDDVFECEEEKKGPVKKAKKGDIVWQCFS